MRESRQGNEMLSKGAVSAYLLPCTHTPHTYPRGPAPRDLKVVGGADQTSASILTTGLLSRNVQTNFCMTTVMRRFWNSWLVAPGFWGSI